MRKTKFLNTKSVIISLLLVNLLILGLMSAVSAKTAEQMMRDGQISDEGVPEGDAGDGMISDVPDDSHFGEDNSYDETESGGTHTDTANTSDNHTNSGTDNNILGGINENDSANGSSIYDSGVNENNFADSANGAGGTDNMTNSESGSVVGIVIAILIIIAIIIIIIALLPKRKDDGTNGTKNKR